ncbi:hypothetical protein G7K_2051-t1 [Saitoella complicata NRRL Y-17804]|uniref:Uncharacterized protein n=1 Tax=Saitoella complicata (strain BCRC 22490 / CBS 7301 / JCM 7358 / NBRC 10748 / NRRL Y-17804) TaxID=698492 RepID=A0A0E9NEL8_SAICN|nr:hypothetical protein G7K_2051-t1 [Saitoella complicata NRRL Y-17804]
MMLTSVYPSLEPSPIAFFSCSVRDVNMVVNVLSKTYDEIRSPREHLLQSQQPFGTLTLYSCHLSIYSRCVPLTSFSSIRGSYHART